MEVKVELWGVYVLLEIEVAFTRLLRIYICTRGSDGENTTSSSAQLQVSEFRIIGRDQGPLQFLQFLKIQTYC